MPSKRRRTLTTTSSSRLNLLENLENQFTNNQLYPVKVLSSEDPMIRSIRKAVSNIKGAVPLQFLKAYTFDKTPTVTKTDIAKLLWYGTLPLKLFSNLETGLESRRGYSGCVFGAGLYFTTSVMLAVGAARSYKKIQLLLLCEVSLGQSREVSI